MSEVTETKKRGRPRKQKYFESVCQTKLTIAKKATTEEKIDQLFLLVQSMQESQVTMKNELLKAISDSCNDITKRVDNVEQHSISTAENRAVLIEQNVDQHLDTVQQDLDKRLENT
jgi:hypothetical protein